MNETARAVASAIAVLVLNIGALVGYSLDATATGEAVAAAVLLLSTAYAIWKNHNFTRAAQEGQKVIDAAKSAQKGGE